MTTFKVLYNYFKAIGAFNNHADIAQKLHVGIRTIDLWCSKGYPKTNAHIPPVELYNQLFNDNVDIIVGFLDFISSQGAYLPEHLKNKEEINTRNFQLFLVSFLTSTSISENTVENTTRNIPSVKLAPTSSEKYFSQSIYLKSNDEDLITLTKYSNPSFSKIINHQHILVEGVGGQGKTLFLNKLYSRVQDAGCFSHVIKIALSDLAVFVENIIRDTVPSDIESYIIYYLSKNTAFDIHGLLNCVNKANSSILFLFDGLNEVYSSPNKTTIQIIENEIKQIEKNWTNAHIIITSRPSKINSLIANYTQTYLSGVPENEYNNFLAQNPNIDDYIKPLAKIPLYFNYLSSVKDILLFKTKYDVLYAIYKQLVMQNKSLELASATYFSFYVIAPIVAQTICETTGTTIKLSQIKTLLEDELKSNLFLDYLYNIVLSDDIIDRYELSMCSKDPEQILRILIGSGVLVKDNSLDCYKFFHDDIRDFLVAYGCVNRLKLINEIYDTNTNFDNLKINLNFSDDISTLIKEKLKLVPPYSSSIDSINSLFSSMLLCSDNANILKKIAIGNFAYFIADYLSMPFFVLEGSIHIILKKALDLCYKYHKSNKLTKVFEKLPPNLQKYYKNAFAGLICKECEYYRKNSQFSEAYELIKMADTIISDHIYVQHHKGKLILFEYQAQKNGLDIKSHIPVDVNTIDDLFDKGIHILEAPAKNNFNLAANLLGMVYSLPSPFSFDVCAPLYNPIEAFWLYYDTVFTDKVLTSYFSKEQPGYTNKEIRYTARQLVALLLNNTVEINDEFYIPNTAEIKKESVVRGNRTPLNINDATFLFADYILSKISNQHAASLNYLRGRVALYKQERDNAYELFKSESNNSFSIIMLKYLFKEDVCLDEEYEKIISNLENPDFDSIDRTHPIYIYCDMKCLELSFNPNCKEKFKNYESRMSERCLKIVKQLTQ